MNKKTEELSIFQFQQRFPDDKACLLYLTQKKWAQGFACDRCKHNKYCRGSKEHARQCTKCRYQASRTSGMLFHKFVSHAVSLLYHILRLLRNRDKLPMNMPKTFL